VGNFNIKLWTESDGISQDQMIKDAKSRDLLMLAVSPPVFWMNDTTRKLGLAAIDELGKRLDKASSV